MNDYRPLFEEPLFLEEETKEAEKNSEDFYIASFDEVGRGSVFGPVAVGGVLFTAQSIQNFSKFGWYNQVKDSKLLSEKEREALFPKIQLGFVTGVSFVAVRHIDQFNINASIQLGVYKLIQKFNEFLSKQNKSNHLKLALVDGNYKFNFPSLNMQGDAPPVRSIVKGDQKLFTMACASIIAKVSRDQKLKRVAAKYSKYLIGQNKGYGTKEHLNAIQKYGMTRLHRKSFLKKLK